jgi:hypothetical protein
VAVEALTVIGLEAAIFAVAADPIVTIGVPQADPPDAVPERDHVTNLAAVATVFHQDESAWQETASNGPSERER